VGEELSNTTENTKNRLAIQFEQIQDKLVEHGAISEKIARSMALPSAAEEIVPRLWEQGVDDVKLAKVLADIYKTDTFSGSIVDRDSLVRSTHDKCPWLIADNVLYVTNPYDRSQVEPLIRRKKDNREKIQFSKLGILAMSDFESDIVVQANYDVAFNTTESSGAWAKEFIDDLLNEAINRKASDIHINPESHGGVIKLRIDGRCQVSNIPGLQTITNERFKLVANNLMERVGKQNNYLEPCSGYLVFQAAHKQVSMRLEMAPVKVFTHTKPKFTVRILNNMRGINKLDQLGLSDQHVSVLREAGRRSSGMIIVTGPTGSGKSTTLKSILRDIRDQFPEKAIYTIEDPVEDQLDGITALEVSKHMGFSEALKSLLRHDPDVIMVGEIRDTETAELALRASMTGHLVLSTLHTNDAHGAINRLRNLGLDDALLAENLLVVTAQRLVNRVCPHCSADIHISSNASSWKKYQKEASLLAKEIKVPFVTQSEGCDHCSYGYTGRHVLNEVFENNARSEKMIAQGEGAADVRLAQQIEGEFTDLWDDGIRLAKQGVTTLEGVELKVNPLYVSRRGLNQAIMEIHKSFDPTVSSNTSDAKSQEVCEN